MFEFRTVGLLTIRLSELSNELRCRLLSQLLYHNSSTGNSDKQPDPNDFPASLTKFPMPTSVYGESITTHHRFIEVS